MIAEEEIDGRQALVAYLNDKLEPVDDKEAATVLRVIFHDGDSMWLTNSPDEDDEEDDDGGQDFPDEDEGLELADEDDDVGELYTPGEEDEGEDAKLSHGAVEYEHPAQGPDHCSECEHYLGNACAIVEDPIQPDDWCSRFTAKPAQDALLPIPLDPDLRTLAENANQSNIIQQIYQLQAERNRSRQWTRADDEPSWKSPKFE